MTGGAPNYLLITLSICNYMYKLYLSACNPDFVRHRVISTHKQSPCRFELSQQSEKLKHTVEKFLADVRAA